VPHFILFPLVLLHHQMEANTSDIHESTLRGPARRLQFRQRNADGGAYATGFGQGGGTVTPTGNLLGYAIVNATGSVAEATEEDSVPRSITAVSQYPAVTPQRMEEVAGVLLPSRLTPIS
jgi:hypothetical protein